MFASNDGGSGAQVQQLTSVSSPAAGMGREYEITLDRVEGDYVYSCIPVWGNMPYRENAEGPYYKQGYNSQLATAQNLPEGITADWAWSGNFLCTQAGSYTFKVSVAADGTLSLTVTNA